MQLLQASLLVAMAALTTPAAARGVLNERRGSMRGGTDLRSLERELGEAMGEAMGCGGQVDKQRLAHVEQTLAPMWRTLPKNAAGNLERRSLRYLVHRHFSRESALHIRGFEPSRPSNASGWGDADILSQRVPGFVERVLESQHKLERGFTLGDAASMVVALEQLVFDSEGSLLERVYGERGVPVTRTLGQRDLEQLLEAYMVHWMLGDDEEGARMLLANSSLLEEAMPHWGQLVSFTHGQVRSMAHARRASPRSARAEGFARPGQNALAAQYSFEDAHRIVGGITTSFASFWDSECASMKAQLVDMDPHRTGRVPLSRFYGTGLDADWRFGESEEYLRELGALDETGWRGKQVIIPNYVQAASNCIVASAHYLVCCPSECEAMLGEIEAQVGAPAARPSELLAIVGNMSSQTTLDDDLPPSVDAALVSQLGQIADANGGEVPLHGRLFAQWLHYAFPRECPFPHKSGAVVTATPSEFGDRYIASNEEMQRHAAAANTSELPQGLDKEELQWMSQWSPDEELISERAVRLRAPWEAGGRGAGGVLLLAAAALVGVASRGRTGKAGGAGPGLLPCHGKAHFV